MQRRLLSSIGLSASLLASLWVTPVYADLQPTPISNAYLSPHLANVPSSWRYLTKAPTSPVTLDGALSSRQPIITRSLLSDTTSFSDVSAPLDKMRERGGFSLLTLWQSDALSVFFGVKEDGFAGLNLVNNRVKTSHDDDTAQHDKYLLDEYEQLTGAPLPGVLPAKLFDD